MSENDDNSKTKGDTPTIRGFFYTDGKRHEMALWARTDDKEGLTGHFGDERVYAFLPKSTENGAPLDVTVGEGGEQKTFHRLIKLFPQKAEGKTPNLRGKFEGENGVWVHVFVEKGASLVGLPDHSFAKQAAAEAGAAPAPEETAGAQPDGAAEQCEEEEAVPSM